MWPVHDVKWRYTRQQTATDFKCGEVGAEQDNAAALLQRLLQMFQSFDVCKFFQLPVATPPATCHLQHANAQ